MKILLLRLPTGNSISADMSDVFDEDVGLYQPLGLLYLYSSLKKEHPHFDVHILDCVAECLDFTAFKERILSFKPDIIGITVLTFQLVNVYRYASAIKQILPETLLVFGGPHTHLFPEEVLNNPSVDYVLTGEGEISFPLLIERIKQGVDLTDVPGLFYRDHDGNVIKGSQPLFVKNLDDLALPDFNALPASKYSSVMDNGLTAMLMTSRGCPFHCIYCDRPHMGSNYRVHSPNRVVEEILNCLNKGIRNFQIFDDTFTLKRSRVLEICKLIQEKSLNITFSVRARVNTVDEELLEVMKHAGCRRISFGVEAGSDGMLKALRKNITVEEVLLAFNLCKKVGIDTLADFILGGPGQTRSDVEETINFALKLDPSYVQFTVMTPFPGTELYRMGLSRGLIKNDYWREFAKNPTEDFETPVWEEHLSRDELLTLFSQAYHRFYKRPKYIIRELIKVRSFGEFYRKAKLGMKTVSFKLVENT